MISLACVVIMLIVAYASLRDGLVIAFANLCNTLFGIVVAFGIWPMAATEMGPQVINGSLENFEDAIPMLLVFVGVVVGLRFLVQYIVKDWDFKLSDLFNKGGAFVVGMVTGYFASGFLVIVLQTIPWHENFLGFEPVKHGFSSRLVPGDQAILKLMAKLNAGSMNPCGAEIARTEIQQKAIEDFERNTARHRRMTETRDVVPFPEPEPEPPPPPEPKVPVVLPTGKKEEAPPEVPPGTESRLARAK